MPETVRGTSCGAAHRPARLWPALPTDEPGRAPRVRHRRPPYVIDFTYADGHQLPFPQRSKVESGSVPRPRAVGGEHDAERRTPLALLRSRRSARHWPGRTDRGQSGADRRTDAELHGPIDPIARPTPGRRTPLALLLAVPPNGPRTDPPHLCITTPTAASRTAVRVKALAFTKTQGSRYKPRYKTHLGIPQHVGVTPLATLTEQDHHGHTSCIHERTSGRPGPRSFVMPEV